MAAFDVRWVVAYSWPGDDKLEIELCTSWATCHRAVQELRSAGFLARPIRVWSESLGDLRFVPTPGGPGEA